MARPAQGVQGSIGPVGAKGDPGIQGAKGDAGAKGDTGAAGTAAAYVHVHSSGVLYPDESTNVAAVTKLTAPAGFYCLRFTVFPTNIIATLEGGSGYISVARVTNINCAGSGPYNVTVEIRDGTNAQSDHSFYISVN